MTDTEKELLSKLAAMETLIAAMDKKLDHIQKQCDRLAKQLPKEYKPLKELPAEILSKNISEFELPLKTVDKLKSLDIHTLGNLAEYPIRKYKSVKFGRTTRSHLNALYTRLDAYFIDWSYYYS